MRKVPRSSLAQVDFFIVAPNEVGNYRVLGSVYLLFYLSVCLFIYLSVYLSVCVSVSHFFQAWFALGGWY